MRNTVKRMLALSLLPVMLAAVLCLTPAAARAEDEVVLRVCNWEEYIDLGDWDPEEDLIDLESGDIFGENSLVDDFETWYAETYGKKVRVEYSTFGTNEDLYNMLTIGDVYDLVCPSDYMIMKLMAEKQLVPLSAEFKDPEREHNYYAAGLSPYIRDIFENHEIGGEPWSDYSAGYMWGITGFVYNPDRMTREEASTWKLLSNEGYNRQITMKDNVRDAYFAALGALKSDMLASEEFRSRDDYAERLQDEMNDVAPETVGQVQKFLQGIKDNLYSFETDSGKADMITGKVVANYQWSGDAVYTMDQAEEDDYYLNFAIPEESTNIYFDGWVMLKAGIGNDAAKQHAAEAFLNFISMPENAIRNMYYIGYTSVISGGDDGRIMEYIDWCYGAETEEEEETEAAEETEDAEASEEGKTEEAEETTAAAEEEKTEETAEAEKATEAETAEEAAEAEEEGEAEEEPVTDYDLSYFFRGMGEHDPDCVITVPEEALDRQLGAQYPSEEVISRASIMIYFDEAQNETINQMWIRVRCFNIESVPLWVWIAMGVLIIGGVAFGLRHRAVRNKQYE